MYSNISELIGKTLKLVNVNRGEDCITFICTDGSEYRMYHEQDCCESVTIDDINGDVESLQGSPILEASERTNHDNGIDYRDESFTWTFYHLRTIKETVVIRWYGSSNGYYSESVDFVRTIDPFEIITHK